MIQPGYFETMNIPLKRGRTFTDGDNDPQAPLRYVVSEETARSLFPGEDALGRRIIVNMKANNAPGEIVGIVGDVKHAGLDGKIRAAVYYPQAHLFFGLGTVVIQTAGSDPLALAQPLTKLIRELDPELAISEVGTMQRWIDESVARPKFQSRLLAGFAALALILALIGIYGVMSYGVAQRTQEMGIRMALGAQRSHVMRMILTRGMRLTLIGLAVGTAGALALGRYLESLLFEVKPADPTTLLAVEALLISVAVAACYVPAWRASRVDPLDSLRYE
jgi:putative ABC transport system permease protein